MAAGRAGRRQAGSPAPAGPEDSPGRARPGVDAKGGHRAGAQAVRQAPGEEGRGRGSEPSVYVTTETDAQKLELKTSTQAEAGTGWSVQGECSPQHSGEGTGWWVRPKTEASLTGDVPKKTRPRTGGQGGESTGHPQLVLSTQACRRARGRESATEQGGGRRGRPPSSEVAGLWPHPSGTHNPPRPAGSLVCGGGGRVCNSVHVVLGATGGL